MMRIPVAMLPMIAIALTMLNGVEARAVTIGLDFTGGIEFTFSDFGVLPRTNGYEFDLTETKSVLALGMWDEGSDGLGESHAITLWNTSMTQLAGVIISGTGTRTAIASTQTAGQWVFADLNAPLNLGPGSYVVGVGFDFPNSDAVRTNSGTITLSTASFFSTSPTQDRFATGGTSVFPNSVSNNFVFGPNVLFSDSLVVIVPEPTTVAFVLLGACLLTRRRPRRALTRVQ